MIRGRDKEGTARHWSRGLRRAAHPHFPFPLPAGCRAHGKRKSEVPAMRHWSHRSLAVEHSLSTGEAIALAIFYDAAIAGERGQPLVEGCVTHAALGSQLVEGEGRSRAAQSRRDALIERAW